MKEYLDLLIEDKWSKRYVFANLIAAIENLPIPKERKLAPNQGNDFINMYRILFENNYAFWLKRLLPLPISGTPSTASTFVRWYLGITEPVET